MPVPAAATRITVENMSCPFRTDANRVQRRPLFGVYRLPSAITYRPVAGFLRTLAVIS